MSLKGKSAIVTGSTSGIGYGIIEAFAKEGANVVLNGFGDADEIENMRAGLEKDYGVKAIYNGADLTSPVESADLVTSTVKELGSIDVVVNNAGVQHVSPVEDFPPEKWDFIISLMLSSPFHIIRTAVPYMKKQNWGRIINISSVHGLVASDKKAAYVSAKHGMVGLSKVVALETANYNITCNTICPGWVLTPLVEKQVDLIAENDGIAWEQAKEKLLSEKQPKLEFTQPEQLGGLACFLCSDHASTITGASLPVDGGWTTR